MQNTGFLTAFWALAKPYWVSEQRAQGPRAARRGHRPVARRWSGSRCSSTPGTTISTTRCEQKDQAEFFRQLWRFTLLALIWIIVARLPAVPAADAADRVAHLAERALPRATG